MGKYNIKKAAALLLIVTIIEKILGFGREMVITSQFGANWLTDSYVAGYLVPNFIMVILNAGLVNVYAPLFLSEAEIDEDEAWNKISSVSTYLMFILLIVTVIGILFSYDIVNIIYRGFDEKSLHAASEISKIFFIGVFIYCASIIEGSVLNCLKHFIYPVVSVCLLSIGMIIFVIVFGDKTNINSIAYGYVVGAAAGLILQYIKLKSINAKLTINFKHYSDFSLSFIRLLTPVLISTSIGQINMFVDRIFASYLTDGSMSYLAYADKVSSLPVMIFSGMVATVVFPELIQHINNEDEVLVKNYIYKSIIATMIFLIPSFSGIIVLNKEIIKLLFERNAFDTIATANTASALFYYSPTIIMYGGMAVIAKVYYSMKDTKTLMYISTATIALNVIFDYILMKPLAHNGLALSTSLVSIIQFITAYFVLKRKINIKKDVYFQKSLFKICISSIIMGAFVYGLKTFIGIYIKSNFIIVAASIISGAIVYFMFLIIFKVDEIKEIINKLKPSSIKREA